MGEDFFFMIRTLDWFCINILWIYDIWNFSEFSNWCLADCQDPTKTPSTLNFFRKFEVLHILLILRNFLCFSFLF